MTRNLVMLAVFAVTLAAVPQKTATVSQKTNIIPLPMCDPNCPFVR